MDNELKQLIKKNVKFIDLRSEKNSERVVFQMLLIYQF